MELQNVIERLAETQQTQAELLKALNSKQRKDAAGTPTFTQLHGLGGLFSGSGVEREVVTAHIRPMGLGAALRRFPSVLEDPRFSAITGYTATSGSRPTNPCDDATKGYVKSCELTALFGLNRQDSQEMDIGDIIRRADRGDHRDLTLMGEVLGLAGFTPSGLNQQQILQVVTMSEMVTMGVNIEREMSVDLWQGTVASGSFPGLDLQIATGQLDARTGNACPALDSDVKDFNYNSVDGTTLDIVYYLSTMEWYLRHIADRTGLMPVQWVLAMRPELWFELSAIWPCRYLTNRCADSAGSQVAVINDQVNVRMRDEMRNGMYIDINGRRYPVVVDDGIYEANNQNDANLAAGEYASSIYFVPIVIRGSFPVTYMEYLDYREAQTDTNLLQGTQGYWWTDNGMYSWSTTNKKGWCYQLHLRVEPRAVLRTPQLAGKIQRIKYTPLQHLRSPYADSPYFMDGGASIIGAGTRYAVWMNGGAGR